MSASNISKASKASKKVSFDTKDESEEVEYENFTQEKNNIILDPYDYYKKFNKSDQFNKKIKLFDDEFDKVEDFDKIEHFEDRNLKAQSVDRLSLLKRTATYKKSEEVEDLTKNNTYLVPNDLNSNSIFSIPFPENTSIELANFTAENVSDLYQDDNVTDLYNNINADMYKGYKTLKFML